MKPVSLLVAIALCLPVVVDGAIAAPNGSPQQLTNARKPQIIAQNERLEEVLKNSSWKAVPSASIGRPSRGFVDTLINVNSINRQGNKITFDLTGRQSFYHRVQGDCSTRQVRLIRGGNLGADNKVYYSLLSEEDNNGVLESVRNLHRTALDFACKQNNTQVANSPAEASTPETSSSHKDNQPDQVGANGVSDTFLSGKVNCKFEPVIKTEGEVTVAVETKEFQDNIGHSIEVRHNRKLPASFTGVNNYKIPGCFAGVEIVNLDSDIKNFGKEYYEVILNVQYFDGSTGLIIYDGCGECNTVGGIKVPDLQLKLKFNSGYYLEDLDKDGALEIVTDSLPLEIYQTGISQIRGQNYESQVTEVIRGKFSLWYARETARRLREDYPGWKNKLPDCPCKAEEAARRKSEFVESNFIGRHYENDYHRDAARFFRSASSAISIYVNPKTGKLLRPGQQCTYDVTGKLITDGAGAGTADAFAPEAAPDFSYFHMRIDVYPFDVLGDYFSIREKFDKAWEEYHITWNPNKGKDDKGIACEVNKVPSYPLHLWKK